MKFVIFRLLLTVFLAGSTFQAQAEPTRISVIYAEADDVYPRAITGLLGGVEKTPGVEIIRLALKDLDVPRLSQMLATVQRGDLIRLAAAGGNIGPIAVLYPDIGEPYRSIFSKIIEGIEENLFSSPAREAASGAARP